MTLLLRLNFYKMRREREDQLFGVGVTQDLDEYFRRVIQADESLDDR